MTFATRNGHHSVASPERSMDARRRQYLMVVSAAALLVATVGLLAAWRPLLADEHTTSNDAASQAKPMASSRVRPVLLVGGTHGAVKYMDRVKTYLTKRGLSVDTMQLEGSPPGTA